MMGTGQEHRANGTMGNSILVHTQASDPDHYACDGALKSTMKWHVCLGMHVCKGPAQNGCSRSAVMTQISKTQCVLGETFPWFLKKQYRQASDRGMPVPWCKVIKTSGKVWKYRTLSDRNRKHLNLLRWSCWSYKICFSPPTWVLTVKMMKWYLLITDIRSRLQVIACTWTIWSYWGT